MNGFVFASIAALSAQQVNLSAKPLNSLQQQLSVAANEVAIIDFPATANDYYRGVISSTMPVTAISIQNSQQQNAKVLTLNPTTEQEIFWSVNESDDYQITIKNGPQPSQVNIELHQMVLKDDQYVSPTRSVESPRLKRLEEELEKNPSSALQRFWQEVSRLGTPLVEQKDNEQALITFLWRGEENNVRLFGAPYEGHTYLTHLGESDVWFVSYTVPQGTRLSYQLAPNVPQISEGQWFEQRRAVIATKEADPLNKYPWKTMMDIEALSTFALGVKDNDFVTFQVNVSQGTVEDFTFHSDILDNDRTVSLYIPPQSERVSQNSPLLITFDGAEYQSKIPTPTILDNLISAGEIPPTFALFVQNPAPSLRSVELPPNPKFADFMSQELLPWVRNHLNQPFSGEQVVVTGSSFGGLASMYLAFRHPEDFGNVLSQSGSFWWSPKDEPGEWLTRQLDHHPKLPIRIYLNAGLFEVEPEFANILQTNRNLFSLLQEKGYHVQLNEFANGHDYFSWRSTLSDGLISLLGSH